MSYAPAAGRYDQYPPLRGDATRGGRPHDNRDDTAMGKPRTIYLDHHATTPVDPHVLEAMLPYFGPKFGNAASRSHSFGWEAEKAVDLARKRVAELAGAAPREIVFTSGATESNNLALKGVAETAKGSHIVTMATEHKAVLDPVKRLERMGFRVSVLAPQRDGLIDVDELRHAIQPDTVLVSVMYANNEIGVIQPVPTASVIWPTGPRTAW